MGSATLRRSSPLCGWSGGQPRRVGGLKLFRHFTVAHKEIKLRIIVCPRWGFGRRDRKLRRLFESAVVVFPVSQLGLRAGGRKRRRRTAGAGAGAAAAEDHDGRGRDHRLRFVTTAEEQQREREWGYAGHPPSVIVSNAAFLRSAGSRPPSLWHENGAWRLARSLFLSVFLSVFISGEE